MVVAFRWAALQSVGVAYRVDRELRVTNRILLLIDMVTVVTLSVCNPEVARLVPIADRKIQWERTL